MIVRDLGLLYRFIVGRKPAPIKPVAPVQRTQIDRANAIKAVTTAREINLMEDEIRKASEANNREVLRATATSHNAVTAEHKIRKTLEELMSGMDRGKD